MILHVCERAKKVPGITSVTVATDHESIMGIVTEAGFSAIMTSPDHPSGTDRIAEAARALELMDNDIVVNIQGDQPLLSPEPVQAMIELLQKNRAFNMTTAACPLAAKDLNNPNRVKVVTDLQGGAIYFSRSPVPFDRDGALLPEKDTQKMVLKNFPGYLRHLGLYAFRNSFLQKFVSLPGGILENIEMLEQLRAIENNYRIGVAVVKTVPDEVDTAEDLERIRSLFKHKSLD